MNNIRKGDEVIVLTGRDKKRRGTVPVSYTHLTLPTICSV